MTTDPLWYKDAIIYQLHVKSFRDANGDGFGDFRGVIEKLDYIEQLGITCIWLLPFYPSPLRDDGYDIASYESIHPTYGTIDDFKAFLEAAHARDIVPARLSVDGNTLAQGRDHLSAARSRLQRLERRWHR